MIMRYFVICVPGFYRMMHYSAEHGLVLACRPSVCLSVCQSVSVTLVDQDHIGWKSLLSWKLETKFCMDY